MNKVLLIGRLVRDPEGGKTSSNITYTRFTIAVNRQFSSSSGNQEADFIPVTAWRNTADFVEKYMRKGALVSVEGRFASSTYTNKEEKVITRYEVVADRVQGLESRGQSTNRSNTASEGSSEMTFANEVSNDKKEPEKDGLPWDIEF